MDEEKNHASARTLFLIAALVPSLFAAAFTYASVLTTYIFYGSALCFMHLMLHAQGHRFMLAVQENITKKSTWYIGDQINTYRGSHELFRLFFSWGFYINNVSTLAYGTKASWGLLYVIGVFITLQIFFYFNIGRLKRVVDSKVS